MYQNRCSSLCNLISAQRYTKSLTSLQRANLLQKSRQNPRERMTELNNALKDNKYEDEPMLKSCGISISSKFTQVEGRVLAAPRLRAGNGEEFFARNGRWNYNNKKLVTPKKINRWLVVNFSERSDASLLTEDLRRCANMKGIEMDHPFLLLEEMPEYRRAPPSVRVEKMLLEVRSRLEGRRPEFILCILPESKNSLLYGPWKRETLSRYGTVSQCIAPSKVDDQYLTNVLLKINAKMGGLNSMLVMEHTLTIPLVSTVPTMILGMDVSHASPGQSDAPSVAAVVSSREWPSISKYRASVRTQSRGAEMIESLFNKTSYNTNEGIKIEDEGIIRELLLDFYRSSGHRKPEQIIIFRDGVSESQFTKVLNIELDQIIEACEFMEKNWKPKFVLIIAQKNHHTRFFETNSTKNVPPGTVIDNHICHPRNNDFYIYVCSSWNDRYYKAYPLSCSSRRGWFFCK